MIVWNNRRRSGQIQSWAAPVFVVANLNKLNTKSLLKKVNNNIAVKNDYLIEEEIKKIVKTHKAPYEFILREIRTGIGKGGNRYDGGLNCAARPILSNNMK